MNNLGIIIILLGVITALAEITDKIRVPYPILLVIAGIGIGLIPGLPHITMDPDIVFLVFLPPVLYAAAWSTSWPDFRTEKRPITLLAIGCVIFTTIAIAFVAHSLIPGFSWPEAFVLGAIISPPDAVAATAATKGLGVPRRVSTILEGESLVNDATGLIAYRYAVAAVLTGSFNLWDASWQFLLVAIGGIALGLLTGWVFLWVHRITPDNPTTDTTLTFLAPYIAYLIGEEIHVSGVLAVVTAGLFLGWNSSEVFTQQVRLQANATWNTILFILNGVIFILIGLQLPEILESIDWPTFPSVLKYGAIVSLAVIVGRIIWVYPGAYVPWMLSKKIRKQEPKIDVRLVTVVAWSGMRGVVSLAAALALPLTMGDKPFPNRELIIFLTFCVIFSTLVLQGLTLRPLIEWLGIRPDGKETEDEHEARLKIASAIIEVIEENYAIELSDEVLNQIKTKYEIRIQRLRKEDKTVPRLDEKQINDFHRIQQELLSKERHFILQMRKQGKIRDEVLRKIEYELDLEETRLILEKAV